MDNFQITYTAVFFLALLTHFVDSLLSPEKLAKMYETSSSSTMHDVGTKWAVLVAGSNGFSNYRHQADICHAYQILKNGGLKDENIIVFMYDDIAFNEENPRKGVIINNPHGHDVYKGVPKDYTGSSVTAHNLLAVILANRTGLKGGSGKVLDSGPSDHIFIYYADHGSPGLLTMATSDFASSEDDLYANDLIDALKTKHARKTYESMVIYIEACEAGSIFEGLLPQDWNIYVTTASNAHESSWAVYCPGFDPSPPDEFDTCLGDLYSVSWMEDSDARNLQEETLEQQYQRVKMETADGKGHMSSHVMEYGNISLNQGPISLYMGLNSNDETKYMADHEDERHINRFQDKAYRISKVASLEAVKQHDADIIYLKEKVRKAPVGSVKWAQAQKNLEDALSHRKHVDSSIQAIASALFGEEEGYQVLKTVRLASQPLVDDWDCLKAMVATFKAYCGPLSTYGKKHTRALANMCNAGVHKDKMTEASLLACGNHVKIIN